ncbi:MAG: nitroreductase family protein [Bacteroidota bacterium]
MATHKEHIPYSRPVLEASTLIENSTQYYQSIDQRRSVRDFSDRPVPKAVIENLIRTAASAPSGAHKQPWTFCAVSNAALKSKIREAAEAEEYESYHGRMSETWLKDLEPIGTDWNKPFLEIAPWLIILFKKSYDMEEGERKKNYYVMESVGIAAGFLISAIHQAGLVTLTHTPSPMNFLQKILDRPNNEKPFLLLPVGYPADDATVPDFERKSLDEVSIWFE